MIPARLWSKAKSIYPLTEGRDEGEDQSFEKEPQNNIIGLFFVYQMREVGGGG